MCISFHFMIYDEIELLDKYESYKGITDRNRLKDIMSEYGRFADGKYLLFHDNSYGETNPYYLLSIMIDMDFDIMDSFDVQLNCSKIDCIKINLLDVCAEIYSSKELNKKFVEEC